MSVLSIKSKNCICPHYKEEIRTYYRIFSEHNFYIIIDANDHKGNGYILIDSIEKLNTILDDYDRLYSSNVDYRCNCTFCISN